MFRRFLSLLICLCLVISLCPVTDASAHCAHHSPELSTDAPVIQEAPVVQDTTGETNVVTENSEYCTSVEEAAVALRQQMKLRAETVVISLRTTEAASGCGQQIFETAIAHTGNPTEGDYLRYHISSYSMSTTGYEENGASYVTFTYRLAYRSTAEQEAIMDTAVQDLKVLLGLDMKGGYESVAAIYNWITSNIVYAEQIVDSAYSAYGAIVNRSAVCQGYAVLLYRLLLEEGIDNRVITGTGNGAPHAWNIVRMDNLYFNVDATWDSIYVQAGLSYGYFLRGSMNFTDHIRDAEFNTAAFSDQYTMCGNDYIRPQYIANGTLGDKMLWMLSEDGQLLIVGSGVMPSQEFRQTPWYAYRDRITSVVVDAGVTTISQYAFSECAKIEKVTLPDSLTSIGLYGFYGCSALTDIQLPDSITQIEKRAFFACSSLEQIVLPQNITQICDEVFSNCTALTDVVIPDSVTRIGAYAFYSCSALTCIDLPDSVTEIGGYAFGRCYKLENIEIPYGVTKLDSTFVSCYALKELTIPDSVTSIGASTFSWCTGLTEITIPFSVSYISVFAFFQCTNLSKVVFNCAAPTIESDAFYDVVATCYYPQGLSSWNMGVRLNYGGKLTWESYELEGGIFASGQCGDNATWAMHTDGTLVISGTGEMWNYEYRQMPWYPLANDILNVRFEEGITAVGQYAFGSCTALKKAELPDSLESIRLGAFFACSALRTCLIPKNVFSIERMAFLWCDRLTGLWVDAESAYFSNDSRGVLFDYEKTKVVYAPGTLSGAYAIPNTVTVIGDHAFSGCSGLADITIPEGVTTIGFDAFSNCSGLTQLVLPSGLQELGAMAFSGCRQLTSMVIPAGVTQIGGSTFSGCTNLVSVELHDGITAIGNSAFTNCTSLTTIVLPAGITQIANNTFYGCTSLTQIVLPAGVTQIGEYAFYNCSGLTRMRLPAGVTQIGNNAMADCAGLTEIVFCGDAPQIGVYAMGNVTAYVYYPIDNETWTQSVKQNYGGMLTWFGCAVDDLCTGSHTYGEWYVLEAARCALEGTMQRDCVNCSAFETTTIAPAGHLYITSVVRPSETTVGYSLYACANCAYSEVYFNDYNNMTYSDAVLFLRDVMLHRGKEVTVYYMDTEPGGDASAEALGELAAGHSGVPMLGDYLSGHPLWRLRSSGWTVSYDGEMYRNAAKFQFTYTTTFEIEQQVDSAVAAVIEELDLEGNTEFEKIKKIHDYICENVVYYKSGTLDCHCAYAPILYGYSVCQGYALLMYRMLLEVGVDCRYITGGTYAGLHAWNIVRIGDVYYNLDATWDDQPGGTSYIWFLKSDANFTDHTRDYAYATEEFYAQYPMAKEDYMSEADNCGENAKWVLYADGTMVIDGTGSITGDPNWGTKSHLIKRIVIKEGITAIESMAFIACDNLQSITIPQTVTRIDEDVFYWSKHLEKIVFMGDAPITEPFLFFYDVHVTAYYPANNSTWTGVVCEDSDGKITWMPYKAKGTIGDNLIWMLLTDGTMIISGQGEMQIAEYEVPPYLYNYASEIKAVIIEEGVTSVGFNAFMECTNLTSVHIADSVTSIGAFAFYNCTSLQPVTIPANVTSIGIAAFYCCFSMTSITFLGDAPAIAEDAFWLVDADGYYPVGNETWTEEVLQSGYGGDINWLSDDKVHTHNYIVEVVPPTCTQIGYTLYTCELCDDWYVCDYVDMLGHTFVDGVCQVCGAEDENVVASGRCGDSITWILSYDGILSISGKGDMWAFDSGTSPWYAYSSSIRTALIGDCITSIGDYAFEQCVNLSSVSISDTVTQIGDYAFRYCTSLSSITFHSDAPVIADNAFDHVVATIYYPAGNETWTADMMQDYGGDIRWLIYCEGHVHNYTATVTPPTCQKYGYTTYLCEACGDSYRSDFIETVDHDFVDGACRFCGLEGAGVLASGTCGDDLTWSLMQDGLLTISGTGPMWKFDSFGAPWYANYPSIRKAVIENGVTSIADYAFERCNNLSSVTIPDTVTSIGYNAFICCSSLVSIELPDGLTTISMYAFYYCQNLTSITIPATVTSIEMCAFYHCSSLSSITFLGDAPAMDQYAFDSVVATAYYPAGNVTWTEDTMQDYGGTLTWVGLQQAVDATIEKGNWTMALDSVIYLNYYPTLTGFADDFDFGTRGGVIIWTGDEDALFAYKGAARDLMQIGKDNCQVIAGMQQNENGEWYVQSNEIFAKNLGDTVYIRVFVEVNGEYVYGGVNYYSAANYCYDILNNREEREDTRNVCAALLQYAAAAQIYFDYKTDALVTNIPSNWPNIDLSQYDLAYNEDYIDALPTTSNVDQHIKDLAASLSGTRVSVTHLPDTLDLQGAIRLTVRYSMENVTIDWSNVASAKVLFWNEDAMADLDALTVENANYIGDLIFDEAEGIYKAQSDHILAKNLGEVVYFSVRIEMNDGTVYRGGLNWYSPEAFVADSITSESGAIEVCKTIAVYSEMARIRFSQ